MSPLPFILIMLPLTLVLKKMRAGYRLAKDMKLYGASKDQLDSLIQVVRIFSQDIKMSFGLEKRAILEMRRGRQVGAEEWTYQTTSTSVK